MHGCQNSITLRVIESPCVYILGVCMHGRELVNSHSRVIPVKSPALAADPRKMTNITHTQIFPNYFPVEWNTGP